MTQVLTRSSSTNKNIVILLYYVKHKAFAYIYIYIYIYIYVSLLNKNSRGDIIQILKGVHDYELWCS